MHIDCLFIYEYIFCRCFPHKGHRCRTSFIFCSFFCFFQFNFSWKMKHTVRLKSLVLSVCLSVSGPKSLCVSDKVASPALFLFHSEQQLCSGWIIWWPLASSQGHPRAACEIKSSSVLTRESDSSEAWGFIDFSQPLTLSVGSIDRLSHPSNIGVRLILRRNK